MSDLHLPPDLMARLAESEQAHRRQQKRAIVILVVSVALGVGVIVYALDQVAKSQPPKVVIDPAKLPPIRPGPPQ